MPRGKIPITARLPKRIAFGLVAFLAAGCWGRGELDLTRVENRVPAPPPAALSKKQSLAGVQKPDRPVRNVILCLGDSLTAGYGVAPEEAWPALLEARFREERIPLRVRNAGVSGSTSAGALENVGWHLDDEVFYAIVAIGANDALRGQDLERTKRNIVSILKAFLESKKGVILAGMKIPPNYGEDYAARFESLYQEIALELNIPFIPFLLEGVGGVPEMNIADGIHPNAAGHRKIESLVFDFLEKHGLTESAVQVVHDKTPVPLEL